MKSRWSLYACAAAAVIVQAVPAQAAARNFDIAAGDASETLSSFADQAGLHLIAPSTGLRGQRTAAVRGDMPVEKALEALLRGTNLSGTLHRGTIIVRPTQLMPAKVAPTRMESSSRVAAPASTTLVAADDVASAPDDDIIVTARKRDERALDVPAAISAVGAREIQNYNLTSVQDIASHVPQLQVSTNTNSGQGIIVLRGVATGANALGADQAVAINVDNVQISNAVVLEMGQYDLGQVEVLKGPQALFFGKNSPGGVITLRSADPTDQLFTQLRMGYEFNAKGKYAEAIASGPLSDTVGVRVVGYVHDEKGAFHNDADPLLAGPVADRVGPNFTKYFGRATLTFKPNDSFDVRLKGSYYNRKGTVFGFGSQEFNCPGGVSPIKPSEDCTLNTRFVLPDTGNVQVGSDPLFRDGAPFADVSATLLSAEMNLHTSYGTLTSVTGYFRSRQDALSGPGGAERVIVLSTNPYRFAHNSFDSASIRIYRTASQELRFASELDGPINFVVGGFVDDTRLDFQASALFATTYFPRQDDVLKGKSASAFSQFSVDLGPSVQITGGGRYTWEKKDVSGIVAGNRPVLFSPNSMTFKNFSPEITARFKPNRDVMIYASYKQGYKSGGYDFNTTRIVLVGTVQPIDQSFRDENVKGVEAGLKASLAGGNLRFDLVGYHYKYSDLQVTFQPPGGTTVTTTNAGAATVKGVEFDGSWTPSFVEGLTLGGSLAYNSAKYTDYTPPCWRTQTFAQGCNIDQDNNGLFDSQDVSGKRLPRAPAWTASLRFGLERSISDLVGFRLNGRMNYSDDYLTEDKLNPFSRQRAYTTFDAGLALHSVNNSWEVALIGKNLTNKIVAVRSIEDLYPAGQVGMYANVSNPRTVLLQLTLRPSALFSR